MKFLRAYLEDTAEAKMALQQNFKLLFTGTKDIFLKVTLCVGLRDTFRFQKFSKVFP